MLRIILGAIAGFIVWIIFLLVSDQIWVMLSPAYVRHQAEFQIAAANETAFMADTTVMIIAVLRSAIFSVAAGYIAALISKENFKSPLLLGIFLLAFGLFIHSMILNNVPLWYHPLILLPLVPLTLFGGEIRQQNSYPLRRTL